MRRAKKSIKGCLRISSRGKEHGVFPQRFSLIARCSARFGLATVQPQLANTACPTLPPVLADAYDQARKATSSPIDNSQRVKLPRFGNVEQMRSVGEVWRSCIARIAKPIDAMALGLPRVHAVRAGTAWRPIPLNSHQQVQSSIAVPISKREIDRRRAGDGRQVHRPQCDILCVLDRAQAHQERPPAAFKWWNVRVTNHQIRVPVAVPIHKMGPGRPAQTDLPSVP